MKKFLNLTGMSLALALFSSITNAAYPENPNIPKPIDPNQSLDPAVCFKDNVVKRTSPSNLSSYGGYAIDVQYIHIYPNKNCHIVLNDAAMKQYFKTGNVSTAFESLGQQSLYGNYTVMGVPRNENNILYKTESNHIITNKKAGNPSDILRFEMLGNDLRTNTRNFNVVIRMKTFTGQVNSYGEPILESFTFNVSDTFKIGVRNHFLFSRNNQLIAVNVYPLKYPIPKR